MGGSILPPERASVSGQKAAREKLDEIAKSTGEAWEHLKEVAEKVWEELEEAVRKTHAE